MNDNSKYKIHMGTKFGPQELFDITPIISSCEEKWFNQTLCKVNNQLVRLGIFNEGDFHWHKHDEEDEFFFILKGELFIAIENEENTVSLKPHHGITISKGVLHRTYVKEPTIVLMVESDSVIPTGDE